MSKYISVLIEYQHDDEEPSFCADMEALGGKVAGVMFDDAFARIDELEDRIEELEFK